MTDDERLEQAYTDGSRRAWLSILQESIRQLRGSAPLEAEKLLAERTDAIAMLRLLCAEFGDNDWSDDLYLADIIEKHLMRHVRK